MKRLLILAAVVIALLFVIVGRALAAPTPLYLPLVRTFPARGHGLTMHISQALVVTCADDYPLSSHVEAERTVVRCASPHQDGREAIVASEREIVVALSGRDELQIVVLAGDCLDVQEETAGRWVFRAVRCPAAVTSGRHGTS